MLVLHSLTKINTVFLFWTAFITRPFDATFGNLLTKEQVRGGPELGTLKMSLVATGLLVAVVFFSSRRLSGVCEGRIALHLDAPFHSYQRFDLIHRYVIQLTARRIEPIIAASYLDEAAQHETWQLYNFEL